MKVAQLFIEHGEEEKKQSTGDEDVCRAGARLSLHPQCLLSGGDCFSSHDDSSFPFIS